jgi:hypothetical protein
VSPEMDHEWVESPTTSPSPSALGPKNGRDQRGADTDDNYVTTSFTKRDRDFAKDPKPPNAA